MFIIIIVRCAIKNYVCKLKFIIHVYNKATCVIILIITARKFTRNHIILRLNMNMFKEYYYYATKNNHSLARNLSLFVIT